MFKPGDKVRFSIAGFNRNRSFHQERKIDQLAVYRVLRSDESLTRIIGYSKIEPENCSFYTSEFEKVPNKVIFIVKGDKDEDDS